MTKMRLLVFLQDNCSELHVLEYMRNSCLFGSSNHSLLFFLFSLKLLRRSWEKPRRLLKLKNVSYNNFQSVKLRRRAGQNCTLHSSLTKLHTTTHPYFRLLQKWGTERRNEKSWSERSYWREPSVRINWQTNAKLSSTLRKMFPRERLRMKIE